MMKPQLINTETAAGLPGTIKPPPLRVEVIFAWKKNDCRSSAVSTANIFRSFYAIKTEDKTNCVLKLQTKVFLGAQQVLMFCGFFPSFSIQGRNKVIVLLLSSVLCFNNGSVASLPPRTSIVSRPQRLSCPQQCCPNPPQGVWQQTLLTTTAPNSEGDKQKQTHWKGVGHICIFYRTQRGVHL